MLNLLPQGWVVEIIPLTVGIQGSFHEPCWLKILNRFRISWQVTQPGFLQELTRQVLKELDLFYRVLIEALCKLHNR